LAPAAGLPVAEDSIQRYGARLHQKIESLEQSAHQAKAIAGAAPEARATIVDATIDLLNERVFSALMDAEQIDELARAAELHDIGKVGIPDAILDKPGEAPGLSIACAVVAFQIVLMTMVNSMDSFRIRSSMVLNMGFPRTLMPLASVLTESIAFAGSLLLRSTWRFRPGELGWPGREGRGAHDPLNAAFNYGYGVLYGQVERALVLAGLDPYAGFIHVDRPGKPSLTLDLIEEFRAPVVDRTILGMVNRGVAVELDGDGLLGAMSATARAG